MHTCAHTHVPVSPQGLVPSAARSRAAARGTETGQSRTHHVGVSPGHSEAHDGGGDALEESRARERPGPGLSAEPPSTRDGRKTRVAATGQAPSGPESAEWLLWKKRQLSGETDRTCVTRVPGGHAEAGGHPCGDRASLTQEMTQRGREPEPQGVLVGAPL